MNRVTKAMKSVETNSFDWRARLQPSRGGPGGPPSTPPFGARHFGGRPKESIPARRLP